LVKSLVLIGFMGTGKTTLGKILARKLNIPQLDLDHYIVEKEGKEIPTIFAEKGEDYFREVETACLKEVLLDGVLKVVTTGGGIVLRGENRELIKKYGLCVALTAQPETIIERVKNDKNRPLLQGGVEERVRTLMKEREGLYDFASIQLPTDSNNIDEVLQELWSHPEFRSFLCENRIKE